MAIGNMACVSITLTEGEGPVTSSYIGSSCVVPSALFDCSRAALIFALLLVERITIAVMKTTVLTIKAVAKELIDIMYNMLVSEL